MIDLSISIVNRSGWGLLRQCIESIKASTHRISYQIIVVDNASTDGSPTLLRKCFPEITTIENSTPHGYGASHNQAMHLSGGRHFLALNNDVVVREGALDCMCELLDRSPQVGLLGCRLLTPDGGLQVSCAHESSILRILALDFVPTAIPLHRLRLREWMREWPHDRERRVDVVQGSCMLCRGELLRKLGGFDEQFEFFREEFDLCRRNRSAGYQVVFTPAAEIVHLGSQTVKLFRNELYAVFIESRYKYFLKHSGRLAAHTVVASAFGGILARLLVHAAVGAMPGRRGAESAQKVRLFASMLRWFFRPERPWRHSDRVRV